MNKEYYLYHFRIKGNSNLDEGYVGVTSDTSKRRWKHYNEPVNGKVKTVLDGGEEMELVILVIGNKDYCLELERALRPHCDIGLNSKSGGLSGSFSDETKSKMSGHKLGIPTGRSGALSPHFGKRGCEALRYGTKGKLNPNFKGIWVTPFGRFESRGLAAESLGIPKATIYYGCITSSNFTDWHFEESIIEN